MKQNNINSLEAIKAMVMKPFHHTFASRGGIENHIDKTIDMIKEIITTHEQQAVEKAKMRLEVEIGLQKFGQLMKEKEAIRQQAVEGFYDLILTLTANGKPFWNEEQRKLLYQVKCSFLEENPSA